MHITINKPLNCGDGKNHIPNERQRHGRSVVYMVSPDNQLAYESERITEIL